MLVIVVTKGGNKGEKERRHEGGGRHLGRGGIKEGLVARRGNGKVRGERRLLERG